MTSSYCDSNAESINVFVSIIRSRDFPWWSMTTTILSRICKTSWTTKSKDCKNLTNTSGLIPEELWPTRMDTKSVKKHIVNVLRTSRALDSRIEFHLNWIKHFRQRNNCKKLYHNCSSFIFSLMGDMKTSSGRKT